MKSGLRTTRHCPLVGFRGLDARDEDGDELVTLANDVAHLPLALSKHGGLPELLQRATVRVRWTRQSSVWCDSWPSGFGRTVGADDSDELIRQVAEPTDTSVDALGEGRWVAWVLGTGDDARVRLTLAMKTSEIRMVMGQHSTLVGRGIREDLPIVNALASSTRSLDRAHVVPGKEKGDKSK